MGTPSAPSPLPSAIPSTLTQGLLCQVRKRIPRGQDNGVYLASPSFWRPQALKAAPYQDLPLVLPSHPV